MICENFICYLCGKWCKKKVNSTYSGIDESYNFYCNKHKEKVRYSIWIMQNFVQEAASVRNEIILINETSLISTSGFNYYVFDNKIGDTLLELKEPIDLKCWKEILSLI